MVQATHAMAPMARDLVTSMLSVIAAPDARDDDHVNATENAISTLGKILKHLGGSVDQDTLVPMWASFLPIREDETEAQVREELGMSVCVRVVLLVGGVG